MAKVDEKFIVKLQGKDFILYDGLIDLAHQEGLISIDLELLQIPSKENGEIAIAKAIAKTKDKTFTDIGDAGPASVNTMIRPHIIRMAATRAKARALRDLTNVGMTAFEEMIGDDNKAPAKTKQKTSNGLSGKQISRLYAIAGSKEIKGNKINAGMVKAQVKKRFNKEVSDLTKKEYDTICKAYEDME